MEEYKARETWPIIICSKKALFVIGEMKIKTLMRYLFILIWMATINRQTITSIGKDVKKLEQPYIVDGIVEWWTSLKKFGSSSKG